ncbi:hypothetical protein QQF64_011998 [Cirrhinus molitorella]|uniref:Uncharacterized protein n=1 Tax=Cirrhinus molitorella TaxID=172907 RepID=A0ABR3LUD9_9TELE
MLAVQLYTPIHTPYDIQLIWQLAVALPGFWATTVVAPKGFLSAEDSRLVTRQYIVDTLVDGEPSGAGEGRSFLSDVGRACAPLEEIISGTVLIK